MIAKLYFNQSDKRYINKTIKEISGLNNLTVEMLDDTTIINPSLKMTFVPEIYDANYLYLQDLQRYYYINDITMSRGYVILHCHVDVLMSFKNQIYEQKCLIKRNERLWNLYQNDDQFKLYQAPSVRVVEFDEGFDMTVNEFVMGVVGDV